MTCLKKHKEDLTTQSGQVAVEGLGGISPGPLPAHGTEWMVGPLRSEIQVER